MQARQKTADILLFTRWTAVLLLCCLGAFGQKSGKPSNDKAMAELESAKRFLAVNPDSALVHAKRALDLGQKAGNHDVAIRSFAMLGESYQKKNLMKQSFASYFKGIALAEKYRRTSLAGTLYNGVGVNYFYLNEIEKSQHYLELAANAKKAAKDYEYYVAISVNLANIEILAKSYAKAIATLREAERSVLPTGHKQYLGAIYNSLGAVYEEVKPDSSVYFYQKSLRFSEAVSDYTTMVGAYQNLGDHYLAQNQFGKAVENMKKAVEVNEKRPEDAYKPALYGRLGEAYETAKDYQTALYYKKLETEAHQRVFTLEKQKAVADLELQYQTEKKAQQLQESKRETAAAKRDRDLTLLAAFGLIAAIISLAYFSYQKRKLKLGFEREKLKFLENILHEIRTPLTLIYGPVSVMKRQPGAHADEIGLLGRNVDKLSALVDELLDASRTGAPHFEIQYRDGDAGQFLKEVVESFSSEARQRNITLELSRTQSGLYCRFPWNAIEKITANLIENSLKYCPEGATVVLDCQLSDQILNIRVSDNGPGIPKGEQHQIFRRFFRGKRAKDVGGTGIGLSIVKELVDVLKGTIILENSTNGASFLVSIPVSEIDAASVEEISSTTLPQLLLIENDADTAAFTISVLRETFDVIHVENGYRALDAIAKSLPDMVLSDVVLEGKSGIDIVRELKANELTNHIPVVLFSAKSALNDRLEGLHAGAEAYIAKPFSPEELTLSLRNILTAVNRNRDLYEKKIHSEKPFEQRIESENAYVNKVIAKVVANMEDSAYSVNELADDLSVSRSQLHKKLVSLTGHSTTGFISMIRLEKAKDLLLAGEGNVTEVAYRCGFSSQSYFTKSFTEHFGKSPSRLLKERQG